MQHLDGLLLLVELAEPESLGIRPDAENRTGGSKGDRANRVGFLEGGEALEAEEAATSIARSISEARSEATS